MPNSIPNSISPQENSLQTLLLDKAIPYGAPHTFASGDLIIAPDKQSQAFYYVIKGSVAVNYTDKDETRITVALIGEGEFFGEIGFFDGETRVRNIQANGDVEVGIFNAETMHAMRTENPSLYIDFLLFILRKICGKFRQMAGESTPVASYAESLSTRRRSTYTESKPLPTTLLHSPGWHFISKKVEDFKSEMFDLSHRLQKNESEGTRDTKVENRCIDLIQEMNSSLPDFEALMKGSGHEEMMWGYVFKEIYPYLMRSRFAERAYFKPKGYAGDFLMMEHIYRNEPQGDGRLGELMDSFCLNRPGSRAIHGRRQLLKQEIERKSKELSSEGRTVKIMNLACGPNRELFDFLADCEYSEMIEALCVDIDAEALQYTNQHVNIFPHRASIRLMSENVIKWALGRAKQQLGKLDIIYSAGLCDYLDEKLFRALVTQCYNHMNPGGMLLLGNFTMYPDRLFMDKLLKWELIYRDEEDLKEIFAPTPFGDNIQIIAERENVNLFAMAHKD